MTSYNRNISNEIYSEIISNYVDQIKSLEQSIDFAKLDEADKMAYINLLEEAREHAESLKTTYIIGGK